MKNTIFCALVVVLLAITSTGCGVCTDTYGGMEINYIGYTPHSSVVRIHGNEEIGGCTSFPSPPTTVTTSSIDIDFVARTTKVVETYTGSEKHDLSSPPPHEFNTLFRGAIWWFNCANCSLEMKSFDTDYRYVYLTNDRVQEVVPNETSQFGIAIFQGDQFIAFIKPNIYQATFSVTGT